MEKTLFIAVPTLGSMNVGTALWLASTAQERPEVQVTVTNKIIPVAFARNAIIRAFLETDCKYLMMVDSDTLPPNNAIDTLMSLLEGEGGADVATAITPIKRDEGRSVNVYKNYPDVEKFQPFSELPEGPFEVVGCGCACILFKREILERIEKPYCKSIEFDDGNYCSEDLFLCEKITKAGGRIVADPRVICGHAKEMIM